MWWRGWSQNAFLVHLREADTELRRKLRANPGTDIALHRRDGLQKRVTSFCRTTPVGVAHRHLRRRLDRWPLQTLPGHRVQRALKALWVSQRRATARVQASYMRTICDGWCTRCRFQTRSGCLFGCGVGEDSVSHFACCPVVSGFFASGIHLSDSRGPNALDDFLCMTAMDTSLPSLLSNSGNGLFDSKLTPNAATWPNGSAEGCD